VADTLLDGIVEIATDATAPLAGERTRRHCVT
jgi:hypothetical protein